MDSRAVTQKRVHPSSKKNLPSPARDEARSCAPKFKLEWRPGVSAHPPENKRFLWSIRIAPIMKRAAPNLPDQTSQPSSWQMLLHSPVVILGMCFLVLAILGIPLIWLSPAFSHRQKWIWSIVITVYTFLLIAIVIAVVWWAISRIQSTF